MELKINDAETKVCSLTASSSVVPCLIANLKPHAWPIATKSHAYSDTNQKFIAQKVEYLLAEGSSNEAHPHAKHKVQL